VNDSSYSNPSDPNSMTDQGHIRNAPYAIDPQARDTLKSLGTLTWKGYPPVSDKERPSTAYVSGNVKQRDQLNQSFYRFGGRTPLGKHVQSLAEVPKLNFKFNTILSTKLARKLAAYNESKKVAPTIVDKDPIVRV